MMGNQHSCFSPTVDYRTACLLLKFGVTPLAIPVLGLIKDVGHECRPITLIAGNYSKLIHLCFEFEIKNINNSITKHKRPLLLK